MVHVVTGPAASFDHRPEIPRWRGIAVMVCCAVVWLGCIGNLPPTQAVDLVGPIDTLSSFAGRWYDDDLALRVQVEVGNPRVQVRLPWGYDVVAGRIDAEALIVTVRHQDGTQRDLAMRVVDADQLAIAPATGAPWCQPWVFERHSAAFITSVRVERAVAGAVEGVVDWLATIL